jgi:hypothetical protein
MSDNNNGENFGILLIVILVCPPLIALLLWVLMELDWIKPCWGWVKGMLILTVVEWGIIGILWATFPMWKHVLGPSF